MREPRAPHEPSRLLPGARPLLPLAAIARHPHQLRGGGGLGPCPCFVFCHYAPYDFQLAAPDAPRGGVPVPLQNLVYHDCVIEPWMMDRVTGGDDYMLYALLNGGAPYLIRDAAYAGIDGDVGGAGIDGTLEDDIARCRVVADLHRRVGMLEMTGFDFVDGDVFRQTHRLRRRHQRERGPASWNLPYRFRRRCLTARHRVYIVCIEGIYTRALPGGRFRQGARFGHARHACPNRT